MRVLTYIVAAIVFVVIGFKIYFYDTYSWNQKLTVTLDTPSGIVEASSVAHSSVTFMDPCRFPGMSQMCVSETQGGESVVVVLPNGKALFVLWMDHPRYLIEDVLIAADVPHRIPHRFDVSKPEFYHALNSKTDPVELQPAELERLKFVTFAELDDRQSIKLLDPKRLSKGLGHGYRLRSVTIQVTNDRVTNGQIYKLLPWLRDVDHRIKQTNKRLVREFSDEERITMRDFIAR